MNRTDLIYIENYKKRYIYTCPKCHGTDNYCTCWAGLRFELKKIHSGIPIKFRDFSFDKLTHPQLVNEKLQLQDYCKNISDVRAAGKSLYLYGSKGLAKTASAQLILMYALYQNYTVYSIESLSIFLDTLLTAWNNKKDFKSEDKLTTDVKALEQKITDIDFLVVDGLGEGILKKESMQSKIKGLFQLRANAMLPTIFVSPVEPGDLRDYTEQAIVNYFSSNMQVIHFEGFDYVENVIKKIKRAE